MNINILTKFSLVIFLLVLAVLASGILVYAQILDGTIRACVHLDGSMSAIIPGFPTPTNCKTTLKWNVQGPSGPIGQQGPMGPQGPAGQQLRLFDANGQDLGVLIDAHPGTFKTFISPTDVLAGFSDSFSGVRINDTGNGQTRIYFDAPDCLGTAYIAPALRFTLLRYGFVSSPGPRYFTYLTNTASTNTPFSISSSGSFGQCTNIVPEATSTIPLREITLPFTEPLASPLRIATQ